MGLVDVIIYVAKEAMRVPWAISWGLSTILQCDSTGQQWLLSLFCSISIFFLLWFVHGYKPGDGKEQKIGIIRRRVTWTSVIEWFIDMWKLSLVLTISYIWSGFLCFWFSEVNDGFCRQIRRTWLVCRNRYLIFLP